MGIFKKTHVLALMACAGLMACKTTHKEDGKVPSEVQTETEDLDLPHLSEALGHFIGRGLKSPGINFDVEYIIKGIREGAAGKPSPMSDTEYESAMAKLQQKVYNNLAETNLTTADKFLQENAHAEGVVEVVPGKLQYVILQEGTGPEVPEHGTPSINYVGKYIDGTVFGTSENAGGAISVPIDQTIPGFSKGIVGMKEGEKRRLFVHPEYGYGKSGQLPPNSLLIFDIEVMKAAADDSEHDFAKSRPHHDSDDERDLDD